MRVPGKAGLEGLLRNYCRSRGPILQSSKASLFSTESGGDEGNHDDFWTGAEKRADNSPADQRAVNTPPVTSQGEVGAGGDHKGWEKFNEEARGPAYAEDAIPRPRHSGKPTVGTVKKFKLSTNRKVHVRKVYGKFTVVDIRQYYRQDGRPYDTPLKKGISLTVPQWNELKSVADLVDAEIEALESEDKEDPEETKNFWEPEDGQTPGL